MVTVDQRQLADMEQRAKKWELVRQKHAEEDELDAAIESRMKAVKQLKAQREQIRQERKSLMNDTASAESKPSQLRFPFGVSDSPLSALHLPKSKTSQLVASGIERIPQLVDLVEGKMKNFPNGLMSIEGMKPASAKQIHDSLQVYLERDPESKKSEKSKTATKEKDEEDEEEFTHKAKLLTDVGANEGYELGKIVVGAYSEADNTFTCKDYVFAEGEFELVS